MQDEQRQEVILDKFDVSKGRCILPNLKLVLSDSEAYIDKLSRFDLLEVLKDANNLVSVVLMEAGRRLSN